MTNTDWLYKLIHALDDIANAAQACDDVPNIAEWVGAIQREERERCAEQIDRYVTLAWQLEHTTHAQVAEHLARTIREDANESDTLHNIS